MKKSLYLLLVLFLCYSCNEKVSFEEPQPAHISALNEIPQKYWGTYADDDDSTTIKIDATTITEFYTAELSDPFEDIFGELEEDDEVNIISQTDEEITFEVMDEPAQTLLIKNDSVFGAISIPDRLFALKNQDIVKNYKGHDYFSVRNSDGDYYLRKVSFEGDVLVISKIKKVLDVKNFISIEKVSNETGKGLKPTKRQFKKISQKSFNVDQKLRRIN